MFDLNDINVEPEAAERSARPSLARVSQPTLRRLILRAIIPVFLLAGWQIWTTTSPNYATPPLQEIVAALIGLPLEVEFWAALGDTFLSLLYGFSFSVAVGLPIAIVAGRVRLLEGIADGYLTMILSVPTAALVPVFIVLFGVGMTARVAVIVVFAMPILVRNAMTGVSSVPRNLLEMGRSFNCSRLQVGRQIILPAAMPEVFAGLRLAASRAVIGMVVAELILISAGVGRLLTLSTASFQMAEGYALAVVLLLISAAFVNAIGYLETRVLRWRDN